MSYIRRDKGSRTPPTAVPERSIRLYEQFSQWNDVLPENMDEVDDTFFRDYPTGWEGYDFVKHDRAKDSHTTILEMTKNGWKLEPVVYSGRIAGQKTPKLLLGLAVRNRPEGQ